jgi:ribosomal protein S16
MKLGALPSDTVKSILKKVKASTAKAEKEKAAAEKEEVTTSVAAPATA